MPVIDLNDTSPSFSPPISKQRRMTKWCILIAAMLTGIMAVVPPVIGGKELMTFLMTDGLTIMCGSLCVGVPLLTMLIFLIFHNAAAQGSKAASITVGVVAILQAVDSAALAFCVFTMMGLSHPGIPKNLFNPTLGPILLGYVLSGAACFIVFILLIMCRSEKS